MSPPTATATTARSSPAAAKVAAPPAHQEPEKGSLTLDPLSCRPSLTNCSLNKHSKEETPLTDCLEELLKAKLLRD